MTIYWYGVTNGNNMLLKREVVHETPKMIHIKIPKSATIIKVYKCGLSNWFPNAEAAVMFMQARHKLVLAQAKGRVIEATLQLKEFKEKLKEHGPESFAVLEGSDP